MIFIFKILIRLGWMKYFNLRYRSSYNNYPITIPVINGMGKENLTLSEQWMTAVITHLLKAKKGAFIDVGVNVGQTLLKLRSVDSNLKYIGFEPNPACVYYVQELIKANAFSNTTLVPAGISDEDHLLILNFYSDGALDSSASIVKDFRPQKIYRKEYVACFQYESFHELLENESISIVKIDVEGAELQVLNSLANMLEQKRPFVLVEILPAYRIENSDRITRQAEIQKLIKKLNYRILRIQKSTFGFTKIDRIDINPPIEDCDYLLCPDEDISLIGPT